MIHVIYAVVLQVAIGLLTGNWWIGAFVSSGDFVGREIAQAEYRWIEHYGSGLRSNMAWFRRFDPRVWDFKSLVDWIGPVIVTFGIAGIA